MHRELTNRLSCNGHPEYNSCKEYCAVSELYDDAVRNNRCYAVEQFDWLRGELELATAQNSQHILVFAHASLITSVLKVTIENSGVSGQLFSLGYADNPKDTFSLGSTSTPDFDIIPDNQPFVDVTFDYWDETALLK